MPRKRVRRLSVFIKHAFKADIEAAKVKREAIEREIEMETQSVVVEDGLEPVKNPNPMRLKPFIQQLEDEGVNPLELHKKYRQYYEDDSVYVEKMQDILFGYPHLGVPPRPSHIRTHLYMGTTVNAENEDCVRKGKYTHLLNCDATLTHAGRFAKEYLPYPDLPQIKAYRELQADDVEFYHLYKHFGEAFAFIDRAGSEGGRALVYSNTPNLASAICIGYQLKCGTPILQATRIVKDERRTALSNRGFIEQLVQYARVRGVLDADMWKIKSRGLTKIDNRRLYSSYLPEVSSNKDGKMIFY